MSSNWEIKMSRLFNTLQVLGMVQAVFAMTILFAGQSSAFADLVIDDVELAVAKACTDASCTCGTDRKPCEDTKKCNACTCNTVKVCKA